MKKYPIWWLTFSACSFPSRLYEQICVSDRGQPVKVTEINRKVTDGFAAANAKNCETGGTPAGGL